MGIEVSNSTIVAKDTSKINILFTQTVLISFAIGVLVIIFYYLGGNVIFTVLLKGVEPGLVFLALLTVPFLLYLMYWNAILVGLEEISFLNKYNLFTILRAIINLT